MKKSLQWIHTVVFVSLSFFIQSQTTNVGIGTNTPFEKLTVVGNLNVSQSVKKVVNIPGVVPSYNLNNGIIAPGDSVFRIYDPGGAAGNYGPNADTIMSLLDTSFVGFEIIPESIALGIGDTLSILTRGADSLLLCGNNCNGNSQPAVIGMYLYIRLKTNADASVGAGFSLLVKRLYPAPATPASVNHASNSMVFDVNKASFRSGVSGGYVQGAGSTAMGFLPYARGKYSVAIGNEPLAYKDYCMVFGAGTAYGQGSACFGGGYAGGDYTITMGASSRADGIHSVAIGRGQTYGEYATAVSSGIAYGSYAFAAGSSSSAIGNYSAAFGLGNRTDSYGAWVLGRNSDYKFLSGQSTNWLPNDLIFFIGDGQSGSSVSNCFEITKNGNGWMQGTLTQASDKRLKKDIQPITKALDKLDKLHGYNYTWKDTAQMGNQVQSGVLAQEVKAVMPELVKEGGENMLSVNYSGLVPYLIEAVKELKKENAALRKLIMKKR
ncbi:MAG: tail fiber domain-containing protein [Bacteroidota bacterium]